MGGYGYALRGGVAFGSYSLSSYDLHAQVAPFIEHFFDVIDGKSSLFYSYAIAGGADVFGTLAYCCISPFTFLFLFFAKSISDTMPPNNGDVAWRLKLYE